MIPSRLVFEAPTGPIPNTRAARDAVAAVIEMAPRAWALLGTWHNPTTLRQAACELRLGIKGWESYGPGWEAETHTMLGEHRLYVRYVGARAEARS